MTLTKDEREYLLLLISIEKRNILADVEVQLLNSLTRKLND